MPQLTGNFGPIAQQVVLDGSGSGTVAFQVNGGTARFTNIFVKVSTTVSQAVAKIYRGTVSDTNLLNQTNSGSTGAAATGIVDVTDGVTLYIVWSGGDAGATATATFTGYTIPFAEAKPSTQLVWNDPIAANDGSLIYPALKSPNYVAGTSGWMIGRDGSAEFANGTFRGSVEVDGLNNSKIVMQAIAGQPQMDFFPPDNVAGDTVFQGVVITSTTPATPETDMLISGPYLGSVGESATIQFSSVTTASKSFLTLSAGNIQISSNHADMRLAAPGIGISAATNGLYNLADNVVYRRSQTGTIALSVTAGAFTTATVTFPFAFPIGVTPRVYLNNTSAAGNANGSTLRAVSISNTGFTLVYGGGTTWTGTATYDAFV